MWDRDQRLASFRIADLYQEADRIRFERLAAETSSTQRRGFRHDLGRQVQRLKRATRRGTRRGMELPTSMFEGHAHNR